MIAIVAALVCFTGIAGLLWLDGKRPEGVSKAVWIPFLWIFFAGSRFASQWWDLGSPEVMGAEEYSDGSPMDRNVFLALMLGGVWMLRGRQIDWSALVKRNAWLVLFFAFAMISVTWADEPLVAFKRWTKAFGNVIMALILVTEKRPSEALGFVLRRLGYVLLPLSILFIRYFPDLGRAYHMGQPMFTGVTFQKNSLGQLCLIVGVYVAWRLLVQRVRPPLASGTAQTVALIALVAMLAWLLYMAQSATAIALMLSIIAFFLLVRLRAFRKRPSRLLVAGIFLAALVVVLEQFVELKDDIIRMLGREPDLTERTPIWDLVLGLVTHPWIGAGYESFWTGGRMNEIWTRLGVNLIQSHNGYIDLYLSLGYIGVALLALAIVSGLAKAQKHLRIDYEGSTLRMSIIFIAVGYNYTEAAFKPLNNIFVLLLFSILQVERVGEHSGSSQVAPPGSPKEADGWRSGLEDDRSSRRSARSTSPSGR
ncbi:MAG: O-antigen ligase family protein [Burkholderiales bacterium]